MFATKVLIICVALISLHHASTVAEPLSINQPTSTNTVADALATCEEQLSKYRKFLLQAIISFEDVCDAYNAHPPTPSEQAGLFHYYQPPQPRSEIWAFFKLLMAQFNDLEFMNVIREAVIERCRIKSQLQRDEKRNSVVLGKKQRFHSWGGKRSPLLGTATDPSASLSAGAAAADEHNGFYFY